MAEYILKGSCSQNNSQYTVTLKASITAGTAKTNVSKLTSAQLIIKSTKKVSLTFTNLTLGIDGDTYATATSKSVDLEANIEKVLLAYTPSPALTFTHGATGKYTASFSAYAVSSASTGPGTITVGGTQALTIDRCATISSVTDFYGKAISESAPMTIDGVNKLKVFWTDNAEDSRLSYKIKYAFQKSSGSAEVKVEKSPFSDIEIPTTWIKYISGTSARGRVDLTTYSDSIKVDTKTKYFWLKAPTTSETKPTVSFKLDYANKLGNACIKDETTVKVTITAEGKEGATISSYSTTICGTSYSGSVVGPVPLTSSGTIKTLVTDSRGQTAEVESEVITVYPYSPPVINAFSAGRCTTGGVVNPNEKQAYTWIDATCSTCGGANNATIQIVLNGNTTTLTMSSGKIRANSNIVACDTEKSFVATCTITDTKGSVVTATATVPTVPPPPNNTPITLGKTSLGILAAAPSSTGHVQIGGSTSAIGLGVTPTASGVQIGSSSIPIGIGAAPPSSGTTIGGNSIGIGVAAPSSGILINTNNAATIQATGAVNIKGDAIGLGAGAGSYWSGCVMVAKNLVPDATANKRTLGRTGEKWHNLFVENINSTPVASFLNNLSFARVDVANITKSSGIGTWTGATGAKANCLVVATRGNDTTAGSNWYVANAWCSADNTIKIIFQAADGGKTTPSSGAVNIIWANGN